jgi:hypothetical protein
MIQSLAGIIIKYQNIFIAGHQWLKPVTLASQKAAIRRISVRGQSGQIIQETLNQKY